MLYLANSLSLNMLKKLLDTTGYSNAYIQTIGWLDAVLNIADEMADGKAVVSSIGHADTAKIIGKFLNEALDEILASSVDSIIELKEAFKIKENADKMRQLFGSLYNRCDVNLDNTDMLIVFQYTGQRLPEGATELPEGAVLQPYLIEIGGLEDYPVLN